MSNRFAVIAFLLLVAGTTAGTTANAQLKIGTVDMSQVFQEYYKSKEAEVRMNEVRLAAKKELEERMESRTKLLEAINSLNQELDSKSLGPGPREEKSKQREDKIAEVRNLEREITEFRTTRERQLQEQAVRMRNAIVEDIMKIVNERVRSDSYDLVFDKTGNSLSGVPLVLRSKDSFDFTTEVVIALNKSKPPSPTAGRATPLPRK